MSVTVQDVVKELCKMGLTGIIIGYNPEQQTLYYDLNTGAKSGLHLFEDFHVEGRYDYTNQLDSDQDVEEIIKDLFWEFRNCLHGRDFFNHQWMDTGVKLGLVEKKVTTHTTVEYV